MYVRLIALCALGQLGCYYDVEPVDAGAAADLVVPVPDFAGEVCTPHHSGELAEAETDASTSGWGAAPIPMDAGVASVVLDPVHVAAGAASLRLDTNAAEAGLFYPDTRNGNFDLSEQLYVSFSALANDSSAKNDPGWKGGQPHVLLVTSTDDYYEYIPTTAFLPRVPGPWLPTTVPIAGGYGWIRNVNGKPDLRHVQYLAWTFSTWGAGFTVWLDDVQIGPNPFADCTIAMPASSVQ